MSHALDVGIHFLLLFSALVAYALTQKRPSPFLRLAALYIIVTTAFDGVAAAIMLTDFMAGVVGDNLFVYHVLTPLQYTILALMYRRVVERPAAKRVLLRSIPLFWLAAVLLTLFVQPLNEYSTYSLLAKYILVTAIVLYFLTEILHAPDEYDLRREPAFWIGVGLLFHSVGSVFVQGVSGALLENSDPLFNLLNTVSSVLNYILFLCFIVAFLATAKPSGSERSIGAY